MQRKNIIISLLFYAYSTVLAQSGVQVKFEEQLQRLNQQVQTAKELLHLFPDRSAQQWVQQAEQLGEEARTLDNSGNIRQAQLKLRLAFETVNRAMAVLSFIPSQRILEQVEELIRRAEQKVPASGNQEAERLLNRAREHLQLAKGAFNRKQSQRGMEYLRISKMLVERCISLVEKKGEDGGNNIETERIRFLNLLERARAVVANCQNPRAERLLQQAQRQAENIEPLLRRGENKIAVGLYYNATRLLLRTIDICEGRDVSEREQVLEEIDFIDNMLAQAQTLGGSQSAAQQRLIIDKVTQLQIQARQAFSQKQYEIAQRKIELSRILLARLWREDATEKGTFLELTRLQSEIERVQSHIAKDDTRFQALLQAAVNSAEDAKRFLERGRTRLALVAILAGTRFLTLAQSITPAVADADARQTRVELDRLQIKIDNQSTESTDLENQEEILFGRQLFQHAQQALSQNNLPLAMEYIRCADELLNRISK